MKSFSEGFPASEKACLFVRIAREMAWGRKEQTSDYHLTLVLYRSGHMPWPVAEKAMDTYANRKWAKSIGFWRNLLKNNGMGWQWQTPEVLDENGTMRIIPHHNDHKSFVFCLSRAWSHALDEGRKEAIPEDLILSSVSGDTSLIRYLTSQKGWKRGDETIEGFAQSPSFWTHEMLRRLKSTHPMTYAKSLAQAQILGWEKT